MKIYKLRYTDKEAAIANFIAKGIYIEKDSQLIYGEGIEAVVEIGLIVLTQGTYDKNGNEITAPIFADGYHYDIMSKVGIYFGKNKIVVRNPKHRFAGY